jgi:hypothetical protein
MIRLTRSLVEVLKMQNILLERKSEIIATSFEAREGIPNF